MRKGLFLLVIPIFIIIIYPIVIEAEKLNIYEGNGIQVTSGLHEFEGQVVSINAKAIIISESGVDFKLIMASQVKICCNGLIASWQSLRPITPQAFFEARIVLNGQNQVILIDGSYRGEECIIQGWWENNGQLGLQLMSVNDRHHLRRLVKSDALLPKENWLAVGQLVYVLYNKDGKVRGIYLPD